MDEVGVFNFKTFCSSIASLGMIIGGVIPYFPQYGQIKRTNNCDGFSTFICLVLLIANILRIIFWFGNQYELPLLIQSIVMIIMMLVLVEICVRVKSNSLLIPVKGRYFLDFDPKYFWEWTDFMSYIEFLSVFTFAIGLLMYLLIDYSLFVETIGYISLITEAMLASPQLIKNYQNKSTFGLSREMVLFWTIGDMFKTCYFIVKSSPIQFLICGACQIAIDFLIAFQIFLYRANFRRRNRK